VATEPSSLPARPASAPPRPAFYALAAGGWRDYVTLLHPPYTAWHLSYAAIGAALAPELLLARFWPTLTAFFLAVGVGAHALDELNGRPLGTRIPGRVLAALGAVAIAGAVAIGIWGAVTVDPWIGVFVAAGALVVVAYNLELAGGRIHNDVTFALAWGAFPLLTAYFAQTGDVTWVALLGATFAAATSYAQRALSTRVRDVRRRVTHVEGRIDRRGGPAEPVTAETLIAAEERALRALALGFVVLAIALCTMRLA
jgi:hypothetical protein